MRYPHYGTDGKLLGHYALEQTDRQGNVYTSQPVPDNHPDIRKWDDDRKPDPNRKGKVERLEEKVAALMARLDELEAKPAKLKV